MYSSIGSAGNMSLVTRGQSLLAIAGVACATQKSPRHLLPADLLLLFRDRSHAGGRSSIQRRTALLCVGRRTVHPAEGSFRRRTDLERRALGAAHVDTNPKQSAQPGTVPESDSAGHRSPSNERVELTVLLVHVKGVCTCARSRPSEGPPP